ncbi:MAG: VWA domain-containing protein, partial [Myxococcales bacterium]|nr:VWA domain-containing protein [Myxococcales bacterium]
MKQFLRLNLLIFGVLIIIGGLLWWMKPPFVLPVIDALTGEGSYSFAYPWMFAALPVLIPALVAVYVRVKNQHVAVMAYTRDDVLGTAPKSLRQRLIGLPIVLRVAAVVALTFAAARPQAAYEETREIDGMDIYIALDMSGSMRTIDLTETELRQAELEGRRPLNRFEVAKVVLKEFVQRRRERPWSDRIGMTVFARNALPQFPLTIDYSTVLWLIDQLQLTDLN